MTESSYERRTIRFLELWRIGPCDVKVYHLAPLGAPAVAPATLQRAFAVTQRLLDGRGFNGDVHRVGFVGIHDGHRGTFLFVDWWADEKELHHRGFYAEDRESFEPLEHDDAIACVWDLHLIAFESEAWREEVLRRGKMARYLGARLNTTL